MSGRYAPHVLATAFVGYAAVSMFPSVPWTSAAWLASLSIAYVVGSRFGSRWEVWWLLCLALSTNLALALLRWPGGDQGVFGNPNFFGCAIAIALVAALVYHLWWFTPIGAFALWYTGSRGAIFATGACSIIYLWRRLPTTAYIVGCAVVIALLTTGKGVDQTHHGSLLTRLGVWQDTLNHLTLFGSGYGSFFEAYASWPVKTNMTLTLAPYAYNDYLELIFELGLGAIFLWWLIIICLSQTTSELRLLLGAVLLMSLTYFPLSLSPVAQLFAYVLGALTKEVRYGALAFEHPALLERSRHRVGA